MDEGVRIDNLHVGNVAVETPIDLGWAIGVLHADDTFTRTCKGCGATATTSLDVKHDGYAKVASAPIIHQHDCPTLVELRRRIR